MKIRELLRVGLGFVAYLFGPLALLFLAAGTLRWPAAWAYTGLGCGDKRAGRGTFI